MSSNNKYIFLVVIVVLVSLGYWYFYLNPSRPQGIEIKIWYLYGTSWIYQTVYDTALPPDLNYTSIFLNNRVELYFPVNVSEYSKSTKNEQVLMQFNNKLKLMAWLDSVQMPNFIRNTLNTLLDKSIPELNKLFTHPDQDVKTIGGTSQGSAIGGATYTFSEKTSAYGNPSLNLKLYEDYGVSYNQKLVWDLLIKLPTIGSDYEVTFTRYPKP